MRTSHWLARGLWLLITDAVGISFVGRPLGMRAGVLAAQQAAQRHTASAHHAGMPGRAGMPMPCPRHDGQCCAPCLACCAGCVTLPAPAAMAAVGTVVATVRVAGTDLTPVPAPRAGGRYLQPPPLGPPTPLVS
jgi:hypothetical protein